MVFKSRLAAVACSRHCRASRSRQRTQIMHMRACMQCYACSRGPAVAHVVRTDRPAQQQPRSATSHHCCSPRSTPAGRVRAASRPAAANRRAAQLSGVRAAPRRCRGGRHERERFRRPHPEHRPAPRPRARSRPLKRGPVQLGACYLNKSFGTKESWSSIFFPPEAPLRRGGVSRSGRWAGKHTGPTPLRSDPYVSLVPGGVRSLLRKRGHFPN